MRRSQLFDVQMAMGALCTIHAGWEVAAHYGAPEHEYAAARWASAMFDLSFLGKLCVTGADRHEFLDRQLTGNIKELPVGRGLHTMALDQNGYMLADMRVYALDKYLLLELACELCHPLIDHLMQHHAGEDAAIQDLTEIWGLLSLLGPESTEALSYLGIHAPPDGSIVSTVLAGRPILLAAHRRTVPSGFDIFMAAGTMVECWNSIAERGVRPAGLEALNALRIEAGVPWFGTDLDNSMTPLEAGLEGVACGKEGSYIGREAVERLCRSGEPPQRLRGIRFANEMAPRAGASIYVKNRKVGRITSAAYSPVMNRVIALAFLKRGYAKPGLQVQVAIGEDKVPAQVVLLPFTAEPR